MTLDMNSLTFVSSSLLIIMDENSVLENPRVKKISVISNRSVCSEDSDQEYSKVKDSNFVKLLAKFLR